MGRPFDRSTLWSATLVATLSIAAAGCLGPSYVVKRHELARLKSVAPDKRGEGVRVVQRFSTASDLPPAPHWAAPPAQVQRHPDAHPDGDMNGLAWWWWSPPYGGPTFAPTFEPAGVAGQQGGPVVTGTVRGGQSAGGGGGSGVASGLGKGFSTAGRDKGSALAAVAAVAVGVGIGLAVTEGARYDGWATVHPSHPVHIVGPEGERRLMPLWQAVEAGVGDDEEAIVVRHEGAGMWLTGRAPLDRVGLTYGFDVSRQELALDDSDRAVIDGGTLSFGAWPMQWLGVRLDAVMGWGQDAGGLGVARFVPRIGLDVMPLRLWRLHIGGSASAGWQSLWRDGPSADAESGGVSSAGVLAQLELTTRLALSFRWQWTWDHARRDAVVGQSFGLGLDVY